MDITNYITNDFKAICIQESMVKVKDFLMMLPTFPVVEDGIYIGSISAQDSETLTMMLRK
jgi:hypothetical protein